MGLFSSAKTIVKIVSLLVVAAECNSDDYTLHVGKTVLVLLKLSVTVFKWLWPETADHQMKIYRRQVFQVVSDRTEQPRPSFGEVQRMTNENDKHRDT